MKKVILILAVIFLSAACTHSKIYNSANELPVYLGAPAGGQKYRVIKHVEQRERICLDYTNSYDVGPIVRKVMQETGADGMSNVTWKTVTSLGTGAINVATMGIANCKDVELEGDAIKFER